MGNTMIDLITPYWEQFVTIHALGKTLGIIYVAYLVGAIAILGILRSIHKYAAGDSIGKPTHSAWTLRFIDWRMVKAGWSSRSDFLDDNLDPIPVGFNLLGLLLDVGIIGAILGLSLLIWPVILLVAITFGPLQWCRNRNIRKKEFIDKLKGTVRGTEAR